LSGPPATQPYTLSLHDALPICVRPSAVRHRRQSRGVASGGRSGAFSAPAGIRRQRSGRGGGRADAGQPLGIGQSETGRRPDAECHRGGVPRHDDERGGRAACAWHAGRCPDPRRAGERPDAAQYRQLHPANPDRGHHHSGGHAEQFIEARAVMESNPLLATLRCVRQSGRMALCGYFLAGFPTPDDFYRMVRAAVGLDVIEFGVPADDPALDGEVIAKAHRVVTAQRGIHAEPALALIGGLRDLPQPRFVMTYAAVGRSLDGFLRLCVENGVHGVLAPDIDPEEGAFVASRARALGLATITLLDARADDETLRTCVELGDLIYLKAALGPTGEKADIEGELGRMIAE